MTRRKAPEKPIDFLKELRRLKKPVERVLLRYAREKEPLGHYRMMREYSLRGGKYLRPGLLLLSIELFGGDMKDGILAAAAMQASEDWLLIHDDVEDHSEYRRHKPTLNALYGDELAVNAGDALHLCMWKMIGDNVRKLKVEAAGWKIFDLFNAILLRTTEGQYLELEWIRRRRVRIPESEYLDMIRRKTAWYTVIGPIMLGAIIAGASEQDLRSIERWGTPFGYAFQIADDYMNIRVPARKQGKESGGDILEGKRTLILSHLLSAARPKERLTIENIYRKRRSEKTEKEKAYVLGLIRKYGSDQYARRTALDYGRQAGELFLKRTAHLVPTRARDIIAAGIAFASDREQ